MPIQLNRAALLGVVLLTAISAPVLAADADTASPPTSAEVSGREVARESLGTEAKAGVAAASTSQRLSRFKRPHVAGGSYSSYRPTGPQLILGVRF